MSTAVSSSNRSSSAIERSAMRMFRSSANCARKPPADLLVDPEASWSRSTSTTSVIPSSVRWNAAAAPTAPPPTTTTSADSTPPHSAELERPQQVVHRQKPDQAILLVQHEAAADPVRELDERIDERLVRGELRHLAARDHAVAHRTPVPLAPRHLGDPPERDEPDRDLAVHDGVRRVAPVPDDLVQEPPERELAVHGLRVAHHQVAYAQAA